MLINKVFYTLNAIRNIKDFIFEFFHLIRKGDILYFLTSGSKMLARAGTTDSAELIIVNSDLEYPKKYFIYDRNNCTILDIGANIGSFAVYYNSQVKNKTHKIYAIEPSKYNFKYLKKNIDLNKSKNILSFKVAIAKKNYLAKLDTTKDVDSFTLIQKGDDTKYVNTESVDAVTLEKFCDDNKIKDIDIMKVDIEGSEFDVFKKSINFIKKHVKLIFVEVHDLNERNNIEIFSKNIVKHKLRIIEVIMNRTLILQNMNI